MALLALIEALKRKDKGFFYLETHAGRGAYNLAESPEHRAIRDAFERLIRVPPPQPELAAYARAVAAWRAHTATPLAYPGSPVLAAQALRPQDRAVLIELMREEASALEQALPRTAAVRVQTGDGFALLRAHLPPVERRGLLLIDPPYEDSAEPRHVEAAVLEALRRFETGVIAVWYPIKDARDSEAWLRSLATRLRREVLVSELAQHPCDSRVALNGSGLLIVNPPYQYAERMSAWLPALHALLDPQKSGHARVQTLSAATPTRG